MSVGRPLNRRRFLRAIGVVTGAAVGMRPPPVGAEPPPETTRIRLTHRPSLCEAPNYVAEELLRGEGFTDVQYVKRDYGDAENSLTKGEVDITMLFGPPMILRMDAGEPIVFLAGVHVGCAEVFASQRIRTFSDLKGKPFALSAPRDASHTVVGAIAAHVGLDPQRDIHWVMHPVQDWPELLAAGKIDGFLTAPPQAQATRARKIGHVILNTATDRRGRSTSAAWSSPAPTSCADIRLPRSVRFAPFSKHRRSVPFSRRRSRDRWKIAGSSTGILSPFNRFARSRMVDGVITTPRMRCGSTRSGSAKPA